MLPRPADGQVLAAQRADAGVRRGGQVGGRNTRPGEGDIDAQQAGKISKSKGSSPFREFSINLARDDSLFPAFDPVSTAHRLRLGRIREVETGLETFYRFFKRYERVGGESFYGLPEPARRSDGDFQPGGDPLLVEVADRRNRFLEAMDDDFNTGGAIGDLFELVRRLNKFVDDEKLEDAKQRQPAKVASLAAGRRRCASWGPSWESSASRQRRKWRPAATTWPAS